MSPEPEDEDGAGGRPGVCRVDADASWEYLSALREAGIYPSTIWPRADEGGRKAYSIVDLVEKIKGFREPEYDNADQCEFCEDVKGLFSRKLEELRKVHGERLWGMCLDCYKAGGVNAGECRYEHAKILPAGAQAAGTEQNGRTGLVIDGM